MRSVARFRVQSHYFNSTEDNAPVIRMGAPRLTQVPKHEIIIEPGVRNS